MPSELFDFSQFIPLHKASIISFFILILVVVGILKLQSEC